MWSMNPTYREVEAKVTMVSLASSFRGHNRVDLKESAK